MICQAPQRPARGFRHVSLPSSTPFQIQVQDLDTSAWRTYASFAFRGEADACLDALRHRGIEARIVDREPVLATTTS